MNIIEPAKSPQPSSVRQAVSRGAVTGALLGLAFIGGYLFREWAIRPLATPANFTLVNEADSLLAESYVGEFPTEQARVYAAVKGLAASLNDPYTFFVEPQVAELDNNRLAGSFGDIGVDVARNDVGQFVIARVYHDNPAETARVMAGDIITDIDGKSVDIAAPDDSEVLAAVRGDVGSKVILGLERNGARLQVEVIRAEIKIPSVFWQPVSSDRRIGLIQITNFTDRSPDEVKQAVTELRAQGAMAYVLDLRGNGGGLVDSAIQVTGQFLDGGPVLYERSKNGSEIVFNAPLGGATLSEPLVVLVNATTASAAEIVAGALQDRGRAVIIGQSTFGKGSAQTIFSLSDGSSLHVTTAEWRTPQRHRLQGQGLTPDILTKLIDGQDAEMPIAIKYLQKLLTALP